MSDEVKDVTGGGAPEAPKKKHWPFVLGIVIVVVAVAGVSFWNWHETPQFCNAICHSPMDSYVENWEDGDPEVFLSAAHGQYDVECLDCHPPVLSEMMSEGIKWVAGDFEDPLPEVNLGTAEFCERCHTVESTIAATADWGGESGVNPHDSHLGVQDCGNCHSVHGTSTMMCDQCHDWEVPEGWINPSEAA